MNCIKRSAIFLLIILLSVLRCSKAPLPTEMEDHPDSKESFGKLIVSAADYTGQNIDSAQVYLNGQFMGFTPLTNENARTGIHSLRIQKEGFEIYAQSVSIETAKSVYIEALLKKLPSNKGLLLVTVDQDSAITTLTTTQNELIAVTSSREKTFILDVGGYYLKTEKIGYRMIHLALEIRVDSIMIQNIRLEKLDNPQFPEIVLVLPDSTARNEVTLISWETKNADRVDIDYIENPGLSGRREVIFRSAGWRHIHATARNIYGSASAVDSIYIYEKDVNPPAVPQLAFFAAPGEVDFGDPIKLTWSSNASHVIIDQGIGVRGPSGTEEIMFKTSGLKIFTAIAYGEGGISTTQNDTVLIHELRQPELPIIALALVDSVQAGMPVTIEWHSQNADRIDVDYVPYPGLNGKSEVIFQSAGKRIVTATAYNAAGQVSTAETLFVSPVPVLPQVAPILVDVMTTVCAVHPIVPQVNYNVGIFRVEQKGYYRLRATVWYNSGDSQKNESFFILIKDEPDKLHYPQDANAGIYKVVPDEVGSPHVSFRDAGLFYLMPGVFQIELHHYYSIAEQFPQFVVDGPITGAESVEVISLKIEYDRP